VNFATSVVGDVDQFKDCLGSRKYLDKVKADQKAGFEAGVNSTPTLFLNGVNIGGLGSVRSQCRGRIASFLTC
jgi:protein-disulfide isomerase